MNIWFEAILVSAICGSLPCGVRFAAAGATPVDATPATLSSIDSSRLEGLKEAVKRIKHRSEPSYRDNSKLRGRLEDAIGDRIYGKSALERMKIVQSLLGQEDYKALRSILVHDLEGSDVRVQKSALRTLGRGLFAMDAQNAIKELVFQEDRTIQLTAFEALVCLDVVGSKYPLHTAILSGVLEDFTAAEVVQALHVSNDPDLSRMAKVLLFDEKVGAILAHALLSALKDDPEYLDVVSTLLKSGRYMPPEREQMESSEHAKVLVQYQLLYAVVFNTPLLMKDDQVKKRVLVHAAGTTHSQLYSMALLALEKSGQDLTYFVKMLDKSNSPKKTQALKLIITRLARQSQTEKIENSHSPGAEEHDQRR